MRFRYKPRGICAREINVSVEDDCITDVEFVGGCIGNHRGIRKLFLGRNIDEIISLLEGVECRGNTSCPDQLAKAPLCLRETGFPIPYIIIGTATRFEEMPIL